MYSCKVSGKTDVGLVRKNNEDTFLIDNSLFIVADGMGGAAAGEIASNLAVEVISNELKDISYSSDKKTIKHVKKSIKNADNEIKEKMKRNPDLSGMGTTIVMGIHFDSRLLIGNVGDSRAYIISGAAQQKNNKDTTRISFADATTGAMAAFSDTKKAKDENTIIRLTRDHSVVMEMVESGVIIEEDIRTHPMRNRITRCLGSIGNSEPDFFWYDISDGDTLLLCSDGLWEMVHEELITAIVNSSLNTEDMCVRLITAANNSGGVDNSTVITAEFTKD